MPLFYATPTIYRQGVAAGFVLLPPGLNLIFNPFFEKGIGWTWTNAFLDTSFYESTVPFCNSSIRLNLGTSPAASVVEVTAHPVTPGQVYNVAVDVLSAGYPGATATPPASPPASWTNPMIAGPHQPTGTVHLQVVFVDGGGATLSTSTVASQGPTTAAWVTVAGSVTVPGGAAGMKTQIALSGETEEDWWADNVVLHLATSPFVPGITLGVLFAQGTMYRPTLPPTLPAATASQQSWLFYNSGTGFYWRSTNAPTTSDDAALGWVVANAAGIVAQSTRRIGIGLPEVVTPIGPVLPASVAAVTAALNVTAATAAVAAANIGDIPYYQFNGTATMPGDTSNLAAVHVVMIDVTGGGSVDHEVYTFRAPLTAGATLPWKSGLFPTPQGGGALTYTPEFRSENLDGTITLPAVDESNLTVNPVAPVVLAPTSVVCSDAGPRTQDPITHFTYTQLAVTIDEPVATATALIPGTRLRVEVSPDGGTTWLDQGFFSSYRGGTISGGTLYQTVVDVKIIIYAAATNWIARVYAAGATYDPGFSAAVTSAAVSIAGLGLPSATLISTLNVAAGAGGSFPYNVVTPDGTQYFEIGDFSFDDTPCLADPYAYFCRVTLQDLDASHNPGTNPEQPFAGQVVSGGTQHTGPVDGAYGTVGGAYTRPAGIAYVRARLYVCNALDGTANSFSNPACGKLQTGVGGGAGYIDVQVAAGGATPSGLIDASRNNPATIQAPVAIVSGKLTIGAGSITNPYLGAAAVQAANMAASSITAANLALAANSVVDSNVANVGVSKLISGTVIFTGDVVMSRGNGNPVIDLSNSGMFLFSAATGGSTGLTSSPYVAIQSSGLSLFSGGNPSVTITSSSVVLWSVNGNSTQPYVQVTSTGLTVAANSGNYQVFVGSSFIQISSPACITQLTSSGMTIQSGLFQTSISSSQISIGYSGGNSLVLTSSSIVLWSVNGNTGFPYLQLTSGSVYLQYNGSNFISMSSGTMTITLNGLSTTITGNAIACGSIFVSGGIVLSAGSLQLGGFSGGTILWPQTASSTTASAGSAFGLPGNPALYIQVYVFNGSFFQSYKIPAWNP
jgi:hypothetical protein